MATIIWNGSTGNWADAARWIGGVVPGIVDTAAIFGGTVANNAAANVSSISINNAATLASTANLNVTSSIGVGSSGSGRADLAISAGTVTAGTSVIIGAAAGNTGFVSVFNSGVLQANTIVVGSASTGTLSIFGGGTVTATSGFTVGSGANLGTINIGETVLAGTINGNIAFGNAGSRIIFNSSNTATYAGNISGAGSVTVNSPSQSAILTGTNTHSGMTTITAGTLQIGNGGTTGSLGSGAVTIEGGATLAFQHSSGVYVNANVISGSGNVVQRGAGSIEILTGNNSYTGTTTVNSGNVLAVGNGGTSGTVGNGDVILANGGNLDLIRSDTQVIANNITGSGFVRIYGNHTAILTGANTYSGLTVIFDGTNTLQIGNGGTSGSLGTSAVSIGAGGTLAFQHGAGQYVNANVISGAGNVVQRGSGALEILTGNNSYTGTTTIDRGTLAVGFGGTTGTLGSGNVIFANSGNLDLIRSDTQVITNNITGAGSVRIYGNHTAVLTGANTYSGTTVIFSGANTLQIGSGGTTGTLGSGAVSIGAGSTLAFQHGSGGYAYANVISGAGNVVHRGGGNVFEALTGNNSYTGTTTIDGGILQIGVSGGTSGTLGSGDVIFTNGGNLDLIRSDTQIIANNLSGAGAVRIYGNHTGILTGTNTSSGTTFIETPSTLQIGNGGTTGSLGSGSVDNNGTLAFQHSAGTYTNANVISGTGAVVQRGTGSTEVLTGNNSYSGSTTINSGTALQIGSGGASGTLGGGSVTNNGTLAFNRSTDIVVGNVISGTGALVKNGTGDLYVTAANTYEGTTTINAGRINIGGIGGNGTTGSLGTGAVNLAGANAELNYFRSNDATIANSISGLGSFTKTGGGVLTLMGTNTYSGVTQISGGTLRAGGINALSSNSVVNIASGARLDVDGSGQTIGGLSGSGIVENSISNVSITLNNSTNTNFSGVIQNGAGLVTLFKGGAGTQTLSGVNTYTGLTVINGGTLALSGTGSISTSARVELGGAGRFDISAISGASTSVRDLNAETGSQFILGGKTLNVTNAISFAGGGAFVGSTGTDAVIFTVAGANFTLAGTNGATFTNWTDGTDSITINGNANANTLTGDEIQATTINGGGGDDMIIGGAGNDVLNGGAGRDRIDGAGGTNMLAGGADDDTYIVNQGHVTINELLGEGNDEVQTNRTSHFLSNNVEILVYTGTAGFFGVGNGLDNVITGGVGVDQLEGRDGNDTLSDGGGPAGDALFGGIGNDIYIVNNLGSSTIEAVGQGIDEVRTTFFIYGLQSNIENLTYINNAQHGAGVGNTLDNVITGGTGIDDLFGRAGNDTLRGGSGSANTVLGQEGDDIYIVEAVGDSVIEFVNEGTDTVQTALASFVLRDNVENLTYTGASTFTGIGATGANTLTGGALDDFLSGLDGADILVGKSGADLLIGGAGADQFRYEGGETGFDRITDFVSGVDKIALRDAGFAQTATFALAQGGTPVATTTNSTFLYNINTGVLSFDADGTGSTAAVVLAQLNAGLTLAPGDFLFY